MDRLEESSRRVTLIHPDTPTPPPIRRFWHRGLAAVGAVPLLVMAGLGLWWLAAPATGPPPRTPTPSASPPPTSSTPAQAPTDPSEPFDTATVLATDEAGVRVVEPGRGIANLDPATGDVRWRIELDGTPDGVQGVPGVGWFVWSSFADSDDRRPPVLLRVDPASGEVLWRIEGRSGFDWGRESLAVSGDQVFIADVADVSDDSDDRVWIAEPSRPAPGGRSSIRAYDVERGVLNFAVAVDGPVGAAVPFRSATTSDGTRALRVNTVPAGSYYLDEQTGRLLADVSLPAPPPGCQVYYGPTAEIGLRPPGPSDGATPAGEASSPPDCVIIAETQDLRLRNGGSRPMTLTWLGRRLSVDPDGVVEWLGSGRALPLGPTVFDVEPYPDLTVWVMAPESSPTAAFRRTAHSLGPVEVGMPVADAAARLGRELELLVHNTDGACAVFAGDPYSPFFRSVAATGGLIITGIDSECPLEVNGRQG